MRLSEREKKVFVAAQLNAKLAPAELAKRLRMKVHTVRYALKALEERGLINRRVVVNTHRLGYLQYSTYLNISFESAATRKAFISQLLNNPDVIDVYEIGGDFQMGVVQRVRELEGFQDFWGELARTKGVHFHGKQITNRISTTVFRRDYLSNTKSKREEVTVSKSGPRIEVKDDDEIILAALNKVPHASLRDLARSLEMPHNSLSKKVRRLEELGAIVGYSYGLRAHRLGLYTFRLFVSTRSLGSDTWSRTKNFVSTIPNAVVLTRCLGSWDFEIMLEVERNEDIQPIVQRLYLELDSDILSIKTVPLHRYLKSQHTAYCVS